MKTSKHQETEGDCPPALCSACLKLVESSNLKWVKVGGISIGMHRQPLVWRLRDDYSSDVIRKNTQITQRLAAAARLIHAIKEHVADPDLLERINKFQQNPTGQAQP